MVDEASTRTFLRKLREFASELNDDERKLLALLIGPGVEQAVERATLDAFFLGFPERDRLVHGLTELARGTWTATGRAPLDDPT
jgi:hypothetical protein